MLLPIAAIIVGLLLLIWSADRFVDGAAATARHFGMPQLLIGIVIIGFGTSAPEMIVSAFSALNGNPGIALGNAYGSNITNIGLILPVLIFVTALSAFLIMDGDVLRLDAWILLGIFFIYMGWTIWAGLRNRDDSLVHDVKEELQEQEYMSLAKALMWVVIGLALLMGSSQLLVWGAVEIARYFGVSDLVVGLTIVAVGTSLPELASSIAAARKNEVDLAVGNIIGSNLFNTLAVVGLAGAISPMYVGQEVFTRDMPVMSVLTILLLVFGFGKKGQINRVKGLILLLAYIGYNFYLFKTAI